MKFDVVIIGGGLAGLTCGIRLQQKGLRTVIVSSGESALHFSSGSFDLLNKLPDGSAVSEPLNAVCNLDSSHPYRKMGESFGFYAEEARRLLAGCGIETTGEAAKNSFRITPMGTLMPTWLTISDFTSFPDGKSVPGKNIVIVNIKGFLDFNTKFIADSFERRGALCRIVSVGLPETERLRKSPTEMRAPNLARVFGNSMTLEALIGAVKKHVSTDDECIVLPAVFGASGSEQVCKLKEAFGGRVCIVPTMPPSVPGVRVQMALRHAFEHSGGVYMLGDSVIKAEFAGGRVAKVYTENHGDIALTAENYVLASGSYFSKGLLARPDSVVEPVFGCDVDFEADRSKWYDVSFFGKQNYISFGVASDEAFRLRKNGETLDNLYGIGAVLGGFDALRQGCGGGVSMLTALYVADNLMKG